MDCPKMAEAMTEHSMCHPGRPLPHGESHAGSPGFDAFQRAKSEEERFSAEMGERERYQRYIGVNRNSRPHSAVQKDIQKRRGAKND